MHERGRYYLDNVKGPKLRCPRVTALSRRLVPVLLLALPFSGVRVICVEAPAEAAANTEQSASVPATDDCERLCALHHVSATTPDSESGSHCALSTNPSCFDIFGSVAVFHAPQPYGVTLVATPVVERAAALYVEPSPSHPGPPPKFQR